MKINSRRGALVVLGLLSPIVAGGRAMSGDLGAEIAVRIKLDDQDPRTVKVHLGFRNDGSQRALLWEKLLAPDGELDSNRFDVVADGRRVAYVGAYTKRAPPKADEFAIIQPGQIVLTTIVLNRYYALPARGRIAVTYDAFNPSVDGQKLLPLRSNTVVVDMR